MEKCWEWSQKCRHAWNQKLKELQTDYLECQTKICARYDTMITSSKLSMEIPKLNNFGFEEVKQSFDNFFFAKDIQLRHGIRFDYVKIAMTFFLPTTNGTRSMWIGHRGPQTNACRAKKYACMAIALFLCTHKGKWGK